MALMLSTCPSLLWSYSHVFLFLLLILLLLAHRYAILWTEKRSGLKLSYSMIRVYKITVPSAKNDVYHTGRIHFGSAHRPVDGVDICRELYDHAVSSTLHPSDPFFSWLEASGQRQVLTYAVMRQAVKAAALRLGVDAAKFTLRSLLIGSACVLRAADHCRRVYPIK